MTFVILVHGGADQYSEDEKIVAIQGLIVAAQKGYEILKLGGSSVEAVKNSLVQLENDPFYNCGYGSCINSVGKVEMDSMIMNGKTLQYGAVASVSCVYNPVVLAYKVMTETNHCFLVGEGANAFAKTSGISICEDTNRLITENQMACFKKNPSFESWIKSNMLSEAIPSYLKSKKGHDTVGAVALDSNRVLSCATSTGGIQGKLPGRIGDSSIIGCGGYANEEGAAVCTGHGESLMKMSAALETVKLIESGVKPTYAAKSLLTKMKEKLEGSGGIIAVNKDGVIGAYCTCDYLPWVSINSEGKIITSETSGMNIL